MKLYSKEAIAILLVALLFLIHLVVALQYYYLDSITLNEFFFWQAKRNELFKGN